MKSELDQAIEAMLLRLVMCIDLEATDDASGELKLIPGSHITAEEHDALQAIQGQAIANALRARKAA